MKFKLEDPNFLKALILTLKIGRTLQVITGLFQVNNNITIYWALGKLIKNTWQPEVTKKTTSIIPINKYQFNENSQYFVFYFYGLRLNCQSEKCPINFSTINFFTINFFTIKFRPIIFCHTDFPLFSLNKLCTPANLFVINLELWNETFKYSMIIFHNHN